MEFVNGKMIVPLSHNVESWLVPRVAIVANFFQIILKLMYCLEGSLLWQNKIGRALFWKLTTAKYAPVLVIPSVMAYISTRAPNFASHNLNLLRVSALLLPSGWDASLCEFLLKVMLGLLKNVIIFFKKTTQCPQQQPGTVHDQMR